jgi:spermidine synthase
MSTLAVVSSPPETRRSVAAWAPYLLYGLTGFTGVLAEQGFEKYMSLLVGATAAASAVVIFAYFLGFALGSWAVASLLRRGVALRPLRTYGTLELVVGFSCILFTYGISWMTGVLGPLETPDAGPLARLAIRFTLGSILILPTAALMGASFPLIAHVVGRAGDTRGHSWLRAYAWNLGGALVAALAGAYAILPAIGIRGAFWMCFAICSLVFAACILTGRGEQASVGPSDRPESRDAHSVREARMLLAAAFACGFVFFALEVLWTHLIATTIGCSVYAFAAMLAAVLLGLLIGAVRAERGARKPVQQSRVFYLAMFLLLVQFRMWDCSQIAYLLELPAPLRQFGFVEAYKVLIAGALIVPPSVILGSIFPSLLRHPMLEQPGRSFLVGYLSTANSLGCLAGTLAGIFFFIPVLGSEWSLRAIIFALGGLGLLFLWRETPEPKRRITGLVGFMMVLGLTVAFHWERVIMTSGMNTYFGSASSASKSQQAGPSRSLELLSFREDAQGGMTTVLEFTRQDNGQKERILLTNGKYEGSSDLNNQGQAQIGFAAIPSLFNQRFDRALLIGLGTGHSALALARMGYRDVDVAEFAPGIVEAAAQKFTDLNENVLSFPNVHLKVEDGRHVLLTDRGRDYDLITIEIASIWFAGATNVYSREFYELARGRLRPGGALQQWVQLHHIGRRELESAIATVRSVFPFVSFWFAGGQGMVVATMEPQSVNEDRRSLIESRINALVRKEPAAADELARALLNTQVSTTQAVDRMIRVERPVINTDHNRWIEYSTPRYNVSSEPWADKNLAMLRSW